MDTTNVAKLLAFVLLDDHRSPWLQGFDSAAIINWIGLRAVGNVIRAYDADWIAVPNIFGAHSPVLGRRVGNSIFLHLDHKSCTALTWIPNGMRVISPVDTGEVVKNQVLLEELISASMVLYEEMKAPGCSASAEEKLRYLGERIRTTCRKN
jgi:hypothetical protein